MIPPRRIPVLVVLLVSVAGCASFSAPPKDRFYRLPGVASSSAQEVGNAERLIYVAPFGASGLHGERALVFAHADGTTLEQHGYHFWVDSPRIMLQQSLAARLEAGVTGRVVTDPTPDAAAVIRGQIRRFEQTDGGTADVELELAVYENARAPAPVFEKAYTRSVTAKDSSVGASVAAIGEATDAILDAFAGEAARVIEP